MSAIKDAQISLYCHFNKIIKKSRTSFLYLALSQKHVKNVCHTGYKYFTKFHFDSTWGSREISMNITSII